jgi:hypothetical protein
LFEARASKRGLFLRRGARRDGRSASPTDLAGAPDDILATLQQFTMRSLELENTQPEVGPTAVRRAEA